MKINVFEGARRIAMAIGGMWVIGWSAYGLFSDVPSPNYEVSPLEIDAAVKATIQGGAAQAAQVGFNVAEDTNPDEYAEMLRVSRRTGVPVDKLFGTPKEAKRQEAMGSINSDTLAQASPTTAKLSANSADAQSKQRSARIERIQSAGIGLVAGLGAGWLAVFMVGWIVRGFFGIPRGADSRPAPALADQ